MSDEENDDRVKELQDQAIHPDDKFSWPKDIAPQDTIHALTDQLTMAEKKNTSEAEVMKLASGETMLEGLYLYDNLEDLLMPKEHLVDLPKSFHFSNCEQSTRFDFNEVHSREEEEKNRDGISKFGYNVIASGGFSCLDSFGLNLRDRYQKSNNAKTTNTKNYLGSYICYSKYNYIPLAKVAFGENQLCLSEAALCELKLIDESPVCDKTLICLRFFENFGTHANKGPFTLGGIVCWSASSEGFQEHELDSVKEETLSRLHHSTRLGMELFSAGLSGELTTSSSDAKASQTEKSNHSVHLSVNKIGGPAEADNLQDWRAGLIASNKTWAVIDKELRLVPVWNIVLKNHQKDFKDAVNVAKSLAKSYEAVRLSPIIKPNMNIKQSTLDDEHWDAPNEGSENLVQNKKPDLGQNYSSIENSQDPKHYDFMDNLLETIKDSVGLNFDNFATEPNLDEVSSFAHDPPSACLKNVQKSQNYDDESVFQRNDNSESEQDDLCDVIQSPGYPSFSKMQKREFHAADEEQHLLVIYAPTCKLG